MDSSNQWHAYQGGTTIGQRGSEEGVIVRDEEHQAGARISLERLEKRAARYAVTCGLYGYFFHTRYCGDEEEARHDFEEMKRQLGAMADLLSGDMPCTDAVEQAVLEAIAGFIDRFPV